MGGLAMSNQSQPFRQHHVTRLLRGAAAAGMHDPTVTVTLLPTGATITIGSGKPDEVAAAIPKSGKPPPASRSSRAPAVARRIARPKTAVVFARGGEPISTRSRFIKAEDPFRDDNEPTDYKKAGKGGDLSRMSGDTKSRKPIKPQRGRR